MDNDEPIVAYLRRKAKAVEPEFDIVEQHRLEEAARLIEMLEAALRDWHERTEWVQQTSLTHELGLHRADVLRQRIESRDAEIERLRNKDILYYEMPGGVRFPVGRAVRGAEPFTHTEGTTYPVTATITDIGSRDD